MEALMNAFGIYRTTQSLATVRFGSRAFGLFRVPQSKLTEAFNALLPTNPEAKLPEPKTKMPPSLKDPQFEDPSGPSM